MNSKLLTLNSQLILLLLAFLGLATVYSLIVPLGEGPDETGHAAYVFFLAREGRLPVQRAAPDTSDVPGEGHQPPLAYALAAPFVAWLPQAERQFDLPGNARFTWAGGEELNAVAHGTRECLPWRGPVLAWHLARLVSVLLGGVTVLCTYLAARALDRGSLLPFLATALVALNPQFLFVSALVTNDVLLVALSTLILWLVIEGVVGNKERVRRGLWHPGRQALAIGAALGLALLTKQSAIILVPIALLGILGRKCERAAIEGMEAAEGHARTAGPVRHLVTVSSCHRAKLVRCLVALGVAAVISGWWYARNWRLYGDPFGLAAFRGEFMTQPFDIASPAAWVAALAQLHDSFWARFGWMNVTAPALVIGLFVGIELGGLAGLLLLLRQTARAGKGWSAGISRGWWAVIALPVLAAGWIVSFALAAGLVAWQGRLLFPALPAITILLARGLTAWENKEQRIENREPIDSSGKKGEFEGSSPHKIAHPRSKVEKSFAQVGIVYVLFFVLCSLFLIALWLPFGVIRPAYSLHVLTEAAARGWDGTALYGRFGKAGERGAELRSWRLAGMIKPGNTLEVALLWHALARQNRDWEVFIHLIDARDEIVAEDNRQPQDGAFPMTQWVMGDWIEDRHPLPLPADLPAGEYTIRVGLYDPRTGERPGVYDQAEKLIGDSLDVGRIIVAGNDGP